MKLHSDITVNGREYPKGTEIPWMMIYPFFLFHMLLFGGSGFFMAYGQNQSPLLFLYAHSGIAITVYLIFYCVIFGRDEIKWMFINALLGIYGIYCEIGWILSFFGRTANEFPWYVHLVPTVYFVLYTFLIRQAILDITRSRENPKRRAIVQYAYVAFFALIYWISP